MSALLAAALLACMQGDATCVMAEDGPITRVYICGLPINGGTTSKTLGFEGFARHYTITIAPECRDA
jgi:hypothetical protein